MRLTSARYAPGDRVQVRNEERPGHIRTPSYIMGKSGWIEKFLGRFRNPESLAYAGSGLPELGLYRVGFRQPDLWEHYSGSAIDTLYIDFYEHWLEPYSEEEEEQ